MTTSSISLSRRAALGLIGAGALCPGAAAAQGLEALSGGAFGTNWQVVAAPDQGLAGQAGGIAALFARMDALFSPWRDDSALSALNAAPAGDTHLPAPLARVVALALEVAQRSGGAFDPTVGPLVARWGFGPIVRGAAPDWRGLRLRGDRLEKAIGDLTLDLCGIAKGRALDAAGAALRAAGTSQALFDLGGECLAIGQHPAGRPWRVAVAPPGGAGPAPAVLALPAGMAVATSGQHAQGYVLRGRRYGHIIDPAAQAPVQGGIGSVTVAAPSAMLADAWATALCAAGAGAGPKLATAQGIAALFLLPDGAGWRQVRTGGIDRLIV